MTLEPFIDPADPDWIDNARTRIKETHAGLTLYNLTANSMFSPGVYSWNGDRWKNTWAYPYGAGNGISIINDSLHIGGSLTKDMTFNTNGHALNFDGTGTLNVNTPVTLADSLIYTYGQPGDGKIMIADANGVGTWQNNNALRTTPAAVLSDTGAIVSPSDGPAFKNTGTYLIIPPGQWFVMITMRADVEGGDGTDRLWVKSTLIREGDTKLDTIYFVGTNRLISGRAYPGKNIISGFLEMKNTTSAPIRFYYSVGDIKVFAGATKPVFIRQIGGKSFRENSIVAFALK